MFMLERGQACAIIGDQARPMSSLIHSSHGIFQEGF